MLVAAWTKICRSLNVNHLDRLKYIYPSFRELDLNEINLSAKCRLVNIPIGELNFTVNGEVPIFFVEQFNQIHDFINIINLNIYKDKWRHIGVESELIEGTIDAIRDYFMKKDVVIFGCLSNENNRSFWENIGFNFIYLPNSNADETELYMHAKLSSLRKSVKTAEQS